MPSCIQLKIARKFPEAFKFVLKIIQCYSNFPNCTYGIRCLFIHPPCRFDRFCTKKHCPFTHHGTGGVQTVPPPETSNPLTSNRIPASSAPVKTFDELPKPTTRGALGSLAEKLAASLKKKTSEKTSEKTEEKAEERTDENVKNISPESNKVSADKEDSDATKSIDVKTVPEWVSCLNSNTSFF